MTGGKVERPERKAGVQCPRLRALQGSVVIRAPVQALPAGEDGDAASEPRRTKKTSRVAYELQVVHVDIIKDAFWAAYPHLLATV